MMRLSEKDAEALLTKIGVKDPVREERERERREKIALDILLAVGTVKDRQAGERWMEPKPITTRKIGIGTRLLKKITKCILAWLDAPRSRQTAPRRPAKRRTPSTRSRKPAPIRLERKEWQDPYFIEPDFSGSARFANGPKVDVATISRWLLQMRKDAEMQNPPESRQHFDVCRSERTW